jgi:hypothetical protein
MAWVHVFSTLRILPIYNKIYTNHIMLNKCYISYICYLFDIFDMFDMFDKCYIFDISNMFDKCYIFDISNMFDKCYIFDILNMSNIFDICYIDQHHGSDYITWLLRNILLRNITHRLIFNSCWKSPGFWD